MQYLFTQNYSDAVETAWMKKNEFIHATANFNGKYYACLKMFSFGINYMTIFWDEHLYKEAPQFQKITQVN